MKINYNPKMLLTRIRNKVKRIRKQIITLKVLKRSKNHKLKLSSLKYRRLKINNKLMKVNKIKIMSIKISKYLSKRIFNKKRKNKSKFLFLTLLIIE